MNVPTKCKAGGNWNGGKLKWLCVLIEDWRANVCVTEAGTDRGTEGVGGTIGIVGGRCYEIYII